MHRYIENIQNQIFCRDFKLRLKLSHAILFTSAFSIYVFIFIIILTVKLPIVSNDGK